MRFRNTITLFCFLLCFAAKAQNSNIFPASPNSSALMEYINLPVSLDTGLPTINYQLFSLKNNSLEVPVTLSYHSAGIKVNEVPSWVGTGWSLNAGGAVSRVIVGIADELDNGFIGINQKGKLVNQTWDAVYVRNANNKLVDTEPDVFYFNFLNFQGKFVFNADGDIVMLPHNDLKIIPPIGPKKVNNFWTIIDNNGTKYKFGTTISSIEKIGQLITSDTGGNVTTFTIAPQISAWYLCEIESATGDKIIFEYKNGSASSFDNKSAVRSMKYFPGYPIINSVEFNTTTSTISNPVYLDKITAPNGYIKFNSPTLREDLLNSYKIDNIQLVNKNAAVLKKINFNHSYFLSSGCSLPECKRLRLDGVSQQTGLTIENLYQFQYNQSINLPSRTSPEIDHWGYYNQNGETILNTGDITNRAPSFAATKANVLQKIIYSTGGDVSFDFELNDFDDNGTNALTGGLRVSKITENFNYGTPVIKEYLYKKGNTSVSSGTSYLNPKYSSQGVIISDDNTHNWNSYKMVSHSLSQLFDLNGSNVKYQEIKIQNPDNSSEINFFTNFISNPDIRNQIDYKRYMADINNLYAVLNTDPFEEPFSPPSITNFNERGYLTKKIYKNNLGQTVYLLDNTYKKVIPTNQYQSFGFSISKFASNTSGTQQVFNIGKYAYKNDIYVLDTKKEIKYDLNNILVGTETFTQYGYSTEFPTLKTSEVVTNSDNRKHKTLYKYAFDLLTESFMLTLKEKNNISNPIIESRLVDDVEIFNKKYFFDYSNGYLNNGSMPLLREIKESKTSKENNNIVFEKYDINGHLLQFSKADNVHTSIIWGYNSEFPIAKLENITYDAIPSNLISSVQSASNMINETNLLNALTTLRYDASLTNAMVTTYTYKPLVGVSSITDPKGLVTYYEYDNFNRLQFVKDKDLNVLQRYCYNYLGQQTDCNIGTATVTTYKNVFKSQTFTKQACSAGLTGSSHVYSVPAGIYSSTISQADADAKASAEIAANGQGFANTNGTCSTAPVVPTGLAFTSATASTINFSWTAVPGATSYKIYKGGELMGSVTTTTGSLSQLNALTSYSVQVSASNGVVDSALCSSLSMSTLPGVPTGLVLTSATASTLNFSWTAVSGVTDYKIYQNGNYMGTVNTTSGSLSGLAASTAYSIQVLATKGSVDGALCLSVSMSTTAALATDACSLVFDRLSGSCTLYKNNTWYLSRSTSGTSTGTLTAGDTFYVEINDVIQHSRTLTITSSVRGVLANIYVESSTNPSTPTITRSGTFTKVGSEVITIQCATRQD